ncbi:MAG: radical SAM protein [Nanoarchaeota archaeon]
MRDGLDRLNIELSAHCSYACVSCPNTFMERRKGHMNLNLFKLIYDEIEDSVMKVFLWNYGEPLLNPQIGEIIAYTNNKGPRTILSTTGVTLSSRDDVSFLGQLGELIISVNGFDEGTYSFHQKGGSLEDIANGLERIKTTMQDSNTLYVLQTVLNSQNISQIEQAHEFAARYGFNKLVLKSFNVMDDKPETRKLFVPEGSKFSRSDTSERLFGYPCLNWMVINWNGDVNLCCWDYEGKIIVGNVREQGVFGVWNSDMMESLKSKLESEKILPYCGSCTMKTTIDERVLHNG